MFATVLLPITLLALSGVLIDQHRRAWFVARGDDQLGGRERKFEHRRFRRRMVASSAIGLIGVLFAIRPVVPETPGWFACYLAALLLSCTLVILLGMGDALASGMHFRQQRNRRQAELAEELIRHHRESKSADKG